MTNAAEAFRQSHPDLFFLDPGDTASLEQFLKVRGILAPASRVVAASKAGEGNMNCTLRVATTEGPLIVKQARPWVEKYPQFAAPWDRACREAEFYQAIARVPQLARMMPRLIDFDPDARVLMLEDLGDNRDYTGLYAGENLDDSDVEEMAGFLARLHRCIPCSGEHRGLANREMRELNHSHIFVVPLTAANGLDLDNITPGLAQAARFLQSDADYVDEVSRLGSEVYLADGGSLLHGDFFPGSLLRTKAGPRVIDPEFAFFGRPEFDVAVFLAHLILSNQPPAMRRLWREAYDAPSGFDNPLMLQLAGVEIMRRLIGYAQLPVRGLKPKCDLLELSRTLVLRPGMQLVEAA